MYKHIFIMSLKGRELIYEYTIILKKFFLVIQLLYWQIKYYII